MSLADRIRQIAANEPKVYEAGKLALLRASRHMQGTASGSVITLNDISPVKHDMLVKVESKNVMHYPYYVPEQNDVVTKNGVTFTDNGDGSVTINGETAQGATAWISLTRREIDKAPNLTKTNNMLDDGEVYCISISPLYGGDYTSVRLVLECWDKENQKEHYYYSGQTFQVDKNRYSYERFRLQVNPGVKVENVTFYPMIEKGSTPTKWTPFMAVFNVHVNNNIKIMQYGPNEESLTHKLNGLTSITVQSLHPWSELTSSVEGVVLKCSYLRDIDTYIDNLMINVALTGGE